MFPPNFTIAVNGHYATHNCTVEFDFRGAVQTDLVYEISLMLPRRHTSK